MASSAAAVSEWWTWGCRAVVKSSTRFGGGRFARAPPFQACRGALLELAQHELDRVLGSHRAGALEGQHLAGDGGRLLAAARRIHLDDSTGAACDPRRFVRPGMLPLRVAGK